jgi:predicted ATP-dependent endonuclease of OLD family
MITKILTTYKGLDLELDNLGVVNFFVGKNGSGKSRLLECIADNIINNDLLTELTKSNSEEVLETIFKPAIFRFTSNTISNHSNNQTFDKTASNFLTLEILPNDVLNKTLELVGSEKIKEEYFVFKRAPDIFHKEGIEDLKKIHTHNGIEIFNEATIDLQLSSASKRKDNNILNYFSTGTITTYEIYWFENLINDFKIKREENDILIFLIDEIENHLHPSIQKEIPELLNTILEKTNSKSFVQFFITTHSLFLVRSALKGNTQNIYHLVNGTLKNDIDKTNFKEHLVKQFDDVLNDLGFEMKDLFYPNCLIYVEGPTDILYLSYWIKIYLNEQFDEENYLKKGVHYNFVEFGGTLAAHLTFKFNNTESNESLEINNLVNVFSLNRKVFFIVDDDKGKFFEKTKQRIKQEINQINNGSIFFRDDRYSTIEDLLPDDAKRYPTEKVKAASENIDNWVQNSYGFDKFKPETKELIEKLVTFIQENN